MLKKAGNGSGDIIPAPVVKEDAIGRLSGAGSIEIPAGTESITFDSSAAEGQFNYGSTADATKFFILLGGDSFAIGTDTTHVFVNKACGYILS